ncbi:MAG: hypothetical protein J6T52_06780 [Bacteroidaceae bacterium]|nr:hypothetical protein [Bacteroidaceae bacterium]
MKKINENIETFENSELFEDKELDQLICDTFEREHIMDDINRQVMKEVKSLKKSPFSLRNILFAFALPFVLVCYVFGIRHLLETFANQPYTYVAVILSSAVMILFATQALKKFSLQE